MSAGFPPSARVERYLRGVRAYKCRECGRTFYLDEGTVAFMRDLGFPDKVIFLCPECWRRILGKVRRPRMIDLMRDLERAKREVKRELGRG